MQSKPYTTQYSKTWWNFLYEHNWSPVTHKSSSNIIIIWSKHQTYFQINLQYSRNSEPYAHGLMREHTHNPHIIPTEIHLRRMALRL